MNIQTLPIRSIKGSQSASVTLDVYLIGMILLNDHHLHHSKYLLKNLTYNSVKEHHRHKLRAQKIRNG